MREKWRNYRNNAAASNLFTLGEGKRVERSESVLTDIGEQLSTAERSVENTG